jgi:apolipoprotein N-acyltransferase
MSTYSETHDGLERVLTGYTSLSQALARNDRQSAVQVFAIVGLATAVAAGLTAWWVAPIEGEIAYQWIGAWTLAVLAMLVAFRTASALVAWFPPAFTRFRLAYRNRIEDERLFELARWDHRLREEIQAIRSRDQTDR